MSGVDWQREENVVVLTLNEPEHRNSLSDTLRDALDDHLQTVSRDPSVRALVLTGAGQAFCAGGNFDRFKRMISGEIDVIEAQKQIQRIVFTLRNLDRPVLAALNGPAMGAGAGIALACDLRVAAPAARFGFVFAQRGLHPDSGTTYFLTRTVGPAKAAELFLLGDLVGADEALRLGLVNRVVAAEELLPQTMELAQKLASGPTKALALTKRSLYRAQHLDLMSAMQVESEALALCFQTEDAQEGANAFLEKRAAVFRGR